MVVLSSREGRPLNSFKPFLLFLRLGSTKHSEENEDIGRKSIFTYGVFPERTEP